MNEQIYIALNGNEIKIDFKRMKRKTIALRILGDSLEVKAPVEVPLEKIQAFIQEKETWILRRLVERVKRREFWSFQDESCVLYKGRKITLRIRIAPQWSSYKVFESPEMLEVWGPDCEISLIEKVLKKWYVEQAKQVISTRLKELASLYGFRYSQFALGNGRTLWGTCKRDGTIRINWRGIFLEPEVLDYLLVHELCHLKEMNHSTRFWDEVEKRMPDWKIFRRKLREEGVLLEAFRS